MRQRDVDARELRERLGRWLEEVLADEPPPEGADAELVSEILRGGERDEETDLRSLWAAVTQLTQEVKLQGRSFDRLAQGLAAAERPANGTAAEGGEPALPVLMDVRDRLERGAQAARECLDRAREGGRLRALAGAGTGDLVQAVEALEQGYEMATERVDRALGTYGVRAIECEGRAFDPDRMSAVAVERDGNAPDGTVLQVVRPGYERNGEILRFAEVRVARRGEAARRGVLEKVMHGLRRTLGGRREEGRG